MQARTLRLTTGTLRALDTLDGWTITSATATIYREPGLTLQRGDRVMCDGDVRRGRETIARVDTLVGDWSDPTSAARALRAIPSAARVEQSRINGRRSAEEGKKGGRPRKPTATQPQA